MTTPPRRLITLYDSEGDEITQPINKDKAERLAAMRKARHERAKILLKQWRTKEKRAKTAIRKLKKTCDYYEKMLKGE
jgi:hypothetical protein